MTGPIILAIETSGKFCSVALSRGEELLAECESAGQYDHSTMLVPHIQEALKQASLDVGTIDAVALSAGPGSYTGLRVGTSTAKAICYATSSHLVAVDTLEAVALEAIELVNGCEIYFPVLDARRMEVYIAAFDGSGNRLLNDMALELSQDTFTPLILAGEKISICGPSTDKCTRELTNHNIVSQPFELHARHLIRPALSRYYQSQFADNVTFTPEYVKAPNITKSSKPLF